MMGRRGGAVGWADKGWTVTAGRVISEAVGSRRGEFTVGVGLENSILLYVPRDKEKVRSDADSGLGEKAWAVGVAGSSSSVKTQ